MAWKITRAQPRGWVMFSAEETQRRGRAKAKDAAVRRAKVDFKLRWKDERKVTGRMVDWAAAHTRATTQGRTRERQSRAVHPTDEPSRGTPR